MSETAATGGVTRSDSTEQRGGVSTEDIFETLSNRRRRCVLHYLKRQGGPASVRELSEQLAAWENDIQVVAVTPKQRKRVYTALHQTHLPRMDRMGVIVYDSERSTIELTPDAGALDIYLEVTRDDELNWADFYLATSAVALALAVVVTLGVYPFSVVPTVVYVSLIPLVFLVAAIVHRYETHSRAIGGDGPPPELLD